MSELFGISASRKLRLNELLVTFFSHSDKNPDGWGMATFNESNVSVEKEAVRASQSRYLKQRLLAGIRADHLLAHIRAATRGDIEYENCQPYVKSDITGRNWTLMHNGTIFEFDALSKYVGEQEGNTDSERVLFYIVDQIRQVTERLGRPLTAKERFSLLDASVRFMSRENKLDLLIYDGEILYAHINLRGSLYLLQDEGAILFSSTRLDYRPWQEMPLNQLIGCVGGEIRFHGKPHPYEYEETEEKQKYLFMDYAFL